MPSAQVSPPASSIDAAEGAFALILEQACRNGPWDVEPADDAGVWWTFVRHRGWPTLGQGWKLHVSATVESAEAVLGRALPILLASTASFKVVASPRRLRQLNTAGTQPSAVGKFLTVYPPSDDEAVRLASALDVATRGLKGPEVASDRRLRPDGVVSYRYGGFSRRLMQRPAGAIVSALEAPDGKLVADERDTGFALPEWVRDVFVDAGVVREPAASTALVADRFAPLMRIRSSARGRVEVAVDSVALRPRVLKRAFASAEPDHAGRGPRDWLIHEADVLRRLGPCGLAPRLFDTIEEDGDLVLVMEHIQGGTLRERLSESRAKCNPVSYRLVLDWGRQLARQLQQLHERGLVFRDLKPENVIVTPVGQLRLIDFELATAIADTDHCIGTGTIGYCSPESLRSQPVAVTDDVYSLGVTLYVAVTGAEPGLAPYPLDVLRNRPPRLLDPNLPDAFANVIERCMAPDVTQRYPSMHAVEDALAGLQRIGECVSVACKRSQETTLEPRARADAAQRARRLGDAMCAAAQPTPGRSGLRVPVSRHPRAYGFAARDVNVGTAGIVLALAELVTVFDDPRHRETLHDAALWLCSAPALGPKPLPGLYVGEAGIGLALLHAGLALGDDYLVDAASQRGRWVQALPHTRLDLFSGTAGRLRFHLWLWDALGQVAHLEAAREAGEVLLQRAITDATGTARWPADDPGDEPCANYAHGAAGIADALLDLYDATGDERYRSMAYAGAAWLQRLAQPALADGSGLDWPSVEGGPGSAGAWCHGAAGTGVFFLHAAQCGLTGGAELARRAARTVAFGTRWSGPSQCHGLAGSIELLLDLYQATRNTGYLFEARELDEALRAFARDEAGVLTVESDWRRMVTPDYMVGYGGVASCWLRLADPESRPRLLSRARPSAPAEVAP
jgi:tRNA A-37 threonylcarbamoyl transferase component Bud32